MSIKNYLKKHLKLLILIILVAISFSLTTRLSCLRAEYFPTNFDRPVSIQLLSEMIGELRTIIASYIFIRTDMYHHEREEKVSWVEDKATLPLHWLVTALDPQQVNSYDFGAYHLAVNLKKTKQAIQFLQEGLKYNPDSYQLHFTMGEIYYIKKDYESSIKYLKEALELADSSIDMKNALRRLYWCYRSLKDYDEAMNYLQMWHQLDPKDDLPPRFAEELKQLKSGQKTEADFEKAKKKTTIKERLELQRKGEKVFEQDNCNEDEDGHEHRHNCGHKH
jgi:tetratricopeptide (TPR) repeat protein